jgi:hypothetical protein
MITIRSWMIVALLALVACSGKYKLDRAQVDAIVNKAEACKDVACAQAAMEELVKIQVEAGTSKNGVAAEDGEYIYKAKDLVKNAIGRIAQTNVH